jgi:hypothetical protein
LSGRDVGALEQVAAEMEGEPVVLPADLAERGRRGVLDPEELD